MKTVLSSWAPAVLWAAFLFFLSSRSHLPGGGQLPINDKVAHGILYLILGGALAWAGRRLSFKRHQAILFLIGILFALSDEWHQSFVPDRSSTFGDLLADGSGLLVGFALGLRWFSRPKKLD
jgi:VanZ family protein